MAGSLLVAGTSSDAGKSLLTAGLCRWLARRGVRVAPFKAQNMSNNSVALVDGGEIGRAQGFQAYACGVEPEVAMNPVLLKPGSDRTSHVVLMGRPYTTTTARSYGALKQVIRSTVLSAFDDLASRFDVVICEGAGSPAEINLRATDIANMGLAVARSIPTVVVGDIDRGGVFASFFGTLALLSAEDQALISGFVVNKFRGDPSLLQPGLEMLTSLTGRPTLGVVPWLPSIAFEAEDSLGLRSDPPSAGPPVGRDVLHVAAVALPRVSNSTDLDALAQEPGVVVRWTSSPAEVLAADLAVVPGSRATVADLAWLRSMGLDSALVARARSGRPVLGLCGGYQMLARTITDEVESSAGVVPGLGLLPVDITFAPQKTLGPASGSWASSPVTTAYEIHHGVATVSGAAAAFLDGVQDGCVFGTHWHGAFDSDDFRRAFLTAVASLAGISFVVAPDTCVADLRAARVDRLADAIEEHLDTEVVLSLLASGAPSGLPFVPPGAPRL